MKRTLGPALTLVVACACGGTPTQPTEPTPPPPASVSAPPAALLQRVDVGGPAGLGTTFTIGQSAQLTATAHYSDGTARTCTETAGWAISNDVVARTTGRPGEISMLAFGDATVSATCNDVIGTLALRVVRGIRIEGLESYVPFMLPSAQLQLRALVVEGAGDTHDCTFEAQWTASNGDVAWLKPNDPGYVFARGPGEAVITAACDGISGSALMVVDHYDIEVTVVDDVSGAPVQGVSVRIPRDQTDAAGRFVVYGNETSEKMTLWKIGYDPIVREETWDQTRIVRVTYPLAPVSGIFLQGADEICGNATHACSPDRPPAARVYAFTAPRAGVLRLDTIWWPGGLYDTLTYDLRCNGQSVRQGTSHGTLRGKWFEVDASTACNYELRIGHNYNGSDRYRYAISVR